MVKLIAKKYESEFSIKICAQKARPFCEAAQRADKNDENRKKLGSNVNKKLLR